LAGGIPENTTADYSIWYDSGGLNYSDSLGLGYDVCAISLSPRGIHNRSNLRTPYNNGSCLVAFDAKCIAAFEQQSEDFAMQLVGQPSAPPYSNLTADSLPGICDAIAQRMMSAPPRQCKPYINQGILCGIRTLRVEHVLTQLSVCTISLLPKIASMLFLLPSGFLTDI
jgi:hypothetical protein